MEIDSDCTDGASMNLQLSGSMCLRLVDAQEYQLTLAMGPIGHVNVVDLSNYYTKTEVNKKLSLKQDKTAPTTLIKVHHNIPINAQEGYVYTACNYFFERALDFSPEDRAFPFAVIKIKPVSGDDIYDYVFDVTRLFPTLEKAQEMLQGSGPIAVGCFEQDGKIYARYDTHEMLEYWGESNEGAAKFHAVEGYLHDLKEKVIPLRYGTGFHFTYKKNVGLVVYDVNDSIKRKYFEREIPIDEKMTDGQQLEYISKALSIKRLYVTVIDYDTGEEITIHPYCVTCKRNNIQMQAYKRDLRRIAHFGQSWRWKSAKYKHTIQSTNSHDQIWDARLRCINLNSIKRHTGRQVVVSDYQEFNDKQSKLFIDRFAHFRARIRTGKWFYFRTNGSKFWNIKWYTK